MKRRHLALAAAFSAALQALSGSIAWAHSPLGASLSGELTGLVQAANLVAVGIVDKVRYVNAVDPESGALVPHAFVTVRLEKVLRGKPEGSMLTLRFIGGPDGQGRFLSVNGVPMFEEGERDVLFVAGNGEKGCPLVRCEYGRFRLLDDRVYDTHGSPVRAILKNNTVARGLPPAPFRRFSFPAPTFDDLMKNPEARRLLEKEQLDYSRAKSRYEAEAPKRVVLGVSFSDEANVKDRDGGVGAPIPPSQPPLQPEIPESAISLGEFLRVVERLSRDTTRSAERVLSVDPKTPIRLTPLRPTLPPGRPAGGGPGGGLPPIDPGSTEAAEIKAFRSNNFNPVLPR